MMPVMNAPHLYVLLKTLWFKMFGLSLGYRAGLDNPCYKSEADVAQHSYARGGRYAGRSVVVIAPRHKSQPV